MPIAGQTLTHNPNPHLLSTPQQAVEELLHGLSGGVPSPLGALGHVAVEHVGRRPESDRISRMWKWGSEFGVLHVYP